MENSKFKTIDEYHSLHAQVIGQMETLRQTIRSAAPNAEETISYNMPAFRQHGILVYYAAYKHHIGFYPTGSSIRVFEDELVDYKTSKGAIQFPINKPIPKALVMKIVKYRMIEDMEKQKTKRAVKKT
jgi:uncharacterized protein YdhG (YjbR/CyaY superfamily)